MSTSDHAVPVSSPYQILHVSVSIKDEEHLPPMVEEHSFTPGAAPISGQLMTNQAPSSSVTMPSTETPDSQRSDQEARPESDEEQEEQDPQDPIVSFDWAELTGRFQHMVEGRNSEDEKLQNEFDNLVKVRLTLSYILEHSLISNLSSSTYGP